MSTLYKRKRSPYWYGKFCHRGELVRFSTEKTKKADAEEVLRQKLDEARGRHRLDDLLAQIQSAINALPASERDAYRQRVARELLRSQARKLALSEAWGVWLHNPKKGNPGPVTLGNYERIWERFRGWMGKQHPSIQFIHEIDEEMAEAYAEYLWATGVSPRTYNAHISLLKSQFKVLAIQAGLPSNVWAGLPRMEGQTESRRPLTYEELVKVVTSATGPMQTMLLLGMYTGMRLGDVCLLKWGNVHFDRGVIEFIPLKTRRKGKVVTIPMHNVLRNVLLEIKGNSKDGLVFPLEGARYLADRGTASALILNHFRACGIATSETVPGLRRKRAVARAGFHSLRHSFVSLCAASGVPQVTLMEMVGHGSPAMTRLYSHAGAEQKRDAVDKLPVMQLHG